MKVSGNATLSGPVEEVWKVLRDPQVLVRTIPGCQRLETIGEDEYRMTVTAGVASVQGTYAGTIRLTDPQPPHSFVLRVSGAGNPGTVDADVTVSLAGDGGSTRLDYDADAVVGGTIAGVGQRMLSSAAKRTAGEFFSNVDAVLTEGPAEAAPERAAEAAPERATEGAAAGEIRPQGAGVFEWPQPAAGGAPVTASDFLKGAAFGAAIALAGVVVGGLLGRTGGARRPAPPRGPSVRVFSPKVEVHSPAHGRRSS